MMQLFHTYTLFKSLVHLPPTDSDMTLPSASVSNWMHPVFLQLRKLLLSSKTSGCGYTYCHPIPSSQVFCPSVQTLPIYWIFTVSIPPVLFLKLLSFQKATPLFLLSSSYFSNHFINVLCHFISKLTFFSIPVGLDSTTPSVFSF